MPRPRNGRINLPLNERIKDGRIFEISKRSNAGVIYMRCSTRFCIGTAKKMPNGEIVVKRGHSNICYNDRDAQLKADFTQALKSALERNFWKLKEIYQTVAAMYPRKIKVLLPFNSIVSSMKNWRRRFYPPCPEDIEGMAMQLEAPENQRLLEYDVGRLVSKRIRDSEGKLHLMIYDPQFVTSEFSNVTKLFIDGTFQTTPRVRGVYQLVTILGIKYDHALPFMHILMANKTQSAYTAVLASLENIIRVESVAVVMTDFEQALRNACKATFRNSQIAGCDVHYDRALLKKIKVLRLTPLIRENGVAKTFLRKLLALAYLPEQLIEAEFALLKNALPPALKRSFTGFIRYYMRQWMTIVKPAGFSVYGLSRRTNNVIESYNSVLAGRMGVHPSAWTFMAKLTKLTSDARDDMQSLRLHKRIKRYPRYATIYKYKQLTNAWKQLHLGQLNPTEFLDRAAALKGHISQRLTNIPEEPLNDEVEMQETPNTFPLEADPDYDHQLFQGVHFDEFAHGHGDALVEVQNHERGDDMLQDDFIEQNEESVDGNDEPEDDVHQGNFIELNEESVDGNDETEDNVHQGNFIELNEEPVDGNDETEDDVHQGNFIELNEESVEVNIDGNEERENDMPEIVMEQNVGAGLELGGVRPDEREPAAIELETSDEDSEIVPDEEILVGVGPPANNSNAADIAQLVVGEVPTAVAQDPTPKVSSSRKKNLRKKRRRQMMAQNNGNPVRPYGHKRRNTRKRKQAPRCIICRTEAITHGYVPCGHNCVCLRCATILAQEDQRKQCPKCRADYNLFIAIYTED